MHHLAHLVLVCGVGDRHDPLGHDLRAGELDIFYQAHAVHNALIEGSASFIADVGSDHHNRVRVAADHLPCGQSDGPTLFQQGVESHQHTGLQDGGGFLYFHQVAILQRLDEIGLHIGVGLAGSFPFHGNAELAHLFGDLLQHQLHAVLGGGLRVFFPSEGLVHPRRVVVHVIQTRKMQQFAHVGVVDAAHGLQLLPLLVQLGVPGGVLRVGEHHAHKVVNLRPCGTGVLHVGQPQSRGDGLCSHGLAGAGRAAKEKVPHLGGLACGELGVLTDVHRLLGNDVPLREDRHLGALRRA